MGRDDSELMIISFSWIEPGQLGTHDSLILFISTTRIIGINSVNSQNGRAALEQPNEIHIAWLPALYLKMWMATHFHNKIQQRAAP